MEAGPANSEGPEPADINSLPEEARQQLTAHIEQLYMRWADEKVPALGGITPREAVKTSEGREKVIGLVNDWENRMSHGPNQPIQFDFEKLRRELGILEK